LKKLLGTAAILGSLGAPTYLSADLAESFGMGSRMTGTSGAGVASINDWTAGFYNMAGVASPMTERAIFGNQEKSDEAAGKIKLLRDDAGGPKTDEKGNKDAIDKKLEADLQAHEDRPIHQMGMSYMMQASLPTIAPTGANDQVAANVSSATKNMVYGAVQLGLIFDLRTLINTPKNLPLRLGVAVSMRDNGTVANVNDTQIEAYKFMRIGTEPQKMTIITGLGAQVWKNRLSIGVGANLFTGGSGGFQMQNVQIDPTGNTQVPNANSSMVLTPSISPVVGIQYRHNIKNRILMIGFNWRGESFMQIDPLNANATTQLLAVNLPLRLALLDFYSPHTFTLGATYFHDEALKISLDGEFQMWSRFRVNSARSTYLSTVGESFKQFNNILLVKLGAESRPGRYINKLKDVPLLVRLGFSFTPAFTPNQSGYSNYLDNNKIAYSLGASYFLKSNSIVKHPVELIFGFQHQIWLARTSTKSGDVLNSTAYQNGFQPNYTYSAQVLVFSLGALIKF